MIDGHERRIVASHLKKLPQLDGEDSAIAEWLARHASLVEQPLGGDPDPFQKLIVLPWPTFFAKHSTEAETLLTHLIELAWFNAPGEGGWEKVSLAWENAGPG